jgi:hypothetical protein
MILIALLLLLTACDDNNDTVWTGLSGVLIFGIIAIIVLHFLKKRSK